MGRELTFETASDQGRASQGCYYTGLKTCNLCCRAFSLEIVSSPASL
jgi:hypothetical protein